MHNITQRRICHCGKHQRVAMAYALRDAACGQMPLLLRGRVELSRHLALHAMPDALRRCEEAEYREILTVYAREAPPLQRGEAPGT